MNPTTVGELLAFTAVSLPILVVYGNVIKMLVKRFLPENLDLLEHVALALAFGATLIPIIVMVLTLLNHSLSTLTICLITAIFVVINLLKYWDSVKRARSTICRFKFRRSLPTLLFLIIFAFHLFPAAGLYVHPGDDPKLYSLITLRIVESGGYTTSWGRYANPNWYHEKTHLTIAGFAGTCAYFHLLTPFSIEKTVLIMTIIYTSLISIGVYFLAKRLFHSQKAGLFSAFTFGTLIIEPNLGWFSWGGHAELSSLFLLPIQLGLYLDYLGRGERRPGQIVIIAFLTAGLAILHPFSILYSLACVVPATLYYILKRRSLFQPLEPAIAFFLSMIFILPVLITAFHEELAIMPLYSTTPNPSWTPMISLKQTAEEMAFSVLFRLSVVYGPATFVLLLLRINEIIHAGSKVKVRPYFLLALWALTLFLLHENNPNGLFVVKFPLWYRIDSNRTFTVTSFAASIVIGASLSVLLKSVTVKKNLRGAGFLRGLKAKKLSLHELADVGIVILLITTQLIVNVLMLDYARNQSPITGADIASFDWILENTSQEDAVFFVFPNDAGQWILVSTYRRVVIPFGVATKHEVHDEYLKKIYPIFCSDPHHIDVLQYLNNNNVTHVYIGSKPTQPSIYGHTPNASSLLNSPVYNLSYHDDGVYIFSYLGAKFTTLWECDNFTTGWNFFGWPEDPTVSLENGTLKMRSAPEGYGCAVHELSLDNCQSFVYLEVKWRTGNNTKFKIELTVNGKTYILIDRDASLTWTTTVINVNMYARGNVSRISFFVDGSQYGYVDYVVLKELRPLGES